MPAADETSEAEVVPEAVAEEVAVPAEVSKVETTEEEIVESKPTEEVTENPVEEKKDEDIVMKDEEAEEKEEIAATEEVITKIDHGEVLLDSKVELSSLEEEETKVST